MRRSFTIPHALLATVLVLGACAAEESSGLWIQDVIYARPPACLVEARATYSLAYGTLDVLHPDADPRTSSPVPVGYYAPLRLINNLIDAQRKPIYRIDDEGMDYMPNHFRVGIVGYEICLSLPQDDDPYRRCAEIPDALNYFVSSGVGTIQNNPTADIILLLPADVLLQFYGNDLNSIPLFARQTLELRVTALGVQESGVRVRSNQFHFPVDVCRGCRNCFAQGLIANESGMCGSYQDEVACEDP